MSDMRTPLGKVRGLGSAKEGTDHFWKQRLTAVANVPLTLFFVAFVVMLSDGNHADIVEALQNPVIVVLLLLVIVSVVYHMRLGMQVIIEDYISAEGPKVLALIGNTFFCAFVGLLSVYSILKIGFGG